jgi:pSer/pThr/pTyr-binding forkhead associated (FHA) protein
MLCPQCQRDNPGQNAFCHTCGTSLNNASAQEPGMGVRRCSRCNTENSRNVQFCRTCGCDIAADRPPGPAHDGFQSPRGAADRAFKPAEPVVTAGRGGGAWPLCKRCGGQNEPNARFCKFCGSPVEAGAAGPAGPTAGPEAPTDLGHEETALRANLVVIQRDGSEGGVYLLGSAQTDIGSREGDIVLADDPYLSPRHARVERRGDKYVLRNLDSANGIYTRLRDAVPLVSGDMFLIGQQVLRFEVLPEAEQRVGPAKQHGVMVYGTPELPRLARLSQYTTEGLDRDVYYLYRDETVLGREQADLVFAEDPFLSRRHAAITMDRAQLRFSLRDLGSSNGTALRNRGEHVLQNGDQFRLGRHLFRFDLAAGGRGGRNP